MNLPRDISGADAVGALERLGFSVARQSSFHVRMVRGARRVTVPMHRNLIVGTLHSILRQAGVSLEDFLDALWPIGLSILSYPACGRHVVTRAQALRRSHSDGDADNQSAGQQLLEPSKIPVSGSSSVSCRTPNAGFPGSLPNGRISGAKPCREAGPIEATLCPSKDCSFIQVLAQEHRQFGVLAQLTKEEPVSRRRPAS